MRHQRMRWLLGLALLAVAMGGRSAFAQSNQAAGSFTLQPGGSATVTFQAFCTDFGKKFPQSIQAPNAVAPDKIRAALAYIQSNNLAADQNQALEAQYAIWQLNGATGSPAGGAGAKAVVNAATTAPATPQGTSLIDAGKSGQATVSLVSWQALGTPVQLGSATDNFYGQGTLTVTNNSQQALTLYMPVGALFPPATAGDQTMAGYASSTQVNNPQPTAVPRSSQQQPNQLPNTGAGDSASVWSLLFGALALCAAGLSLLRLKRR